MEMVNGTHQTPVMVTDEEGAEHGRWFGPQFCPCPDERIVDGCYFCGAPIRVPGYHDHTDIGDGRFSCVCAHC